MPTPIPTEPDIGIPLPLAAAALAGRPSEKTQGQLRKAVMDRTLVPTHRGNSKANPHCFSLRDIFYYGTLRILYNTPPQDMKRLLERCRAEEMSWGRLAFLLGLPLDSRMEEDAASDHAAMSLTVAGVMPPLMPEKLSELATFWQALGTLVLIATGQNAQARRMTWDKPAESCDQPQAEAPKVQPVPLESQTEQPEQAQ